MDVAIGAEVDAVGIVPPGASFLLHIEQTGGALLASAGEERLPGKPGIVVGGVGLVGRYEPYGRQRIVHTLDVDALLQFRRQFSRDQQFEVATDAEGTQSRQIGPRTAVGYLQLRPAASRDVELEQALRLYRRQRRGRNVLTIAPRGKRFVAAPQGSHRGPAAEAEPQDREKNQKKRFLHFLMITLSVFWDKDM